MAETWTIDQYRDHLAGKSKQKTSKYKNKKVTIDGNVFDSIAEGEYYKYLKMLRDAGEVEFFLRQVPFDLPGGVKYKLDYLVFYKSGNRDYVDIKGFETRGFKDKKKQVEDLYPVRIRCLKRSGNKFVEVV